MRSLWKGSISFGLVNIPVQMFTASREKELKFVLLHKKDLSKIRYAHICKDEEKEVPWADIVKGYEYEKGNFVVMEDADFEKADLKKVKTIEIVDFVDEDEIDSMYYVKPYFLEPDKNATKAYAILRDALQKSKKVGIVKYVLRNHENLAALKAHGDMLILNELRYENELLHPEDLDLPEPSGKASSKEIDMAIKLIDQGTVAFEPKKYKDTYSEEIKAILKQKAKGRPIHPKGEKPAQPSKVHDIMSLLQASLEEKKKPTRKKLRKTA